MHPYRALLLLIVSAGLIGAESLTGRITDPQGAAVAGAKVSLFATDNTIPLVTKSDAKGAYRFERLRHGAYVLQVESPGLRSDAAPFTLSGDLNKDVELFVEGVSNSVLVTAESSAMTLDQTAKAVSLIESSEVTERNEYMLAEILRNTPGVQVRQLGGPGQFTQLRIRGLRPDAVAVLIDGLRFRDPSTTQGDATSFMSTLNFVNASRVEVLRGSASSLYGTNAVGGSVNVVTDSGGSPTHGALQAEGGGLGFLRGRGTLAGGFWENRLQYSLGLTHINVMTGNDGNDANRSTSIQTFARYQFTPRFSLSGRLFGSDDFVQTNISPATTGIPASNFPPTGIIQFIGLPLDQIARLNAGQPVVWGPTTAVPARDDPDARRTSRFSTIALIARYDISPRTSAQASYSRVNTERYFLNGPGGSGFQPAATSLTNPRGTLDNVDGRLNLRPTSWLSLMGGYEFEHEIFRDRQNNNLPAPRNISVQNRVGQKANSGYFGGQLPLLNSRLMVTFSGRAQWFSLLKPSFATSGITSPYEKLTLSAPPRALTGDVSVAYFVPRTNTKFRAHVGNSYRAPALYERFGGGFFNNPADGSVNFTPYGDPRLSPDRYNSFDWGFDQYLFREKLRVSATHFYNRVVQQILFDSSGIIRPATDPYGRTSGYFNAAGGITRGFEFSAEARPSRSFTVSGSYTYTNADNDQPTGVTGFYRVLNVPAQVFTAVATQRFGRRIDVNVDMFWSSAHYFPLFAVNRTRIFEIPGYAKADIVAGYQLWTNDRKSARLYGKLENFLNQYYYEGGYIAPRAWGVVGMQFNF